MNESNHIAGETSLFKSLTNAGLKRVLVFHKNLSPQDLSQFWPVKSLQKGGTSYNPSCLVFIFKQKILYKGMKTQYLSLHTLAHTQPRTFIFEYYTWTSGLLVYLMLDKRRGHSATCKLQNCDPRKAASSPTSQGKVIKVWPRLE